LIGHPQRRAIPEHLGRIASHNTQYRRMIGARLYQELSLPPITEHTPPAEKKARDELDEQLKAFSQGAPGYLHRETQVSYVYRYAVQMHARLEQLKKWLDIHTQFKWLNAMRMNWEAITNDLENLLESYRSVIDQECKYIDRLENTIQVLTAKIPIPPSN